MTKDRKDRNRFFTSKALNYEVPKLEEDEDISEAKQIKDFYREFC